LFEEDADMLEPIWELRSSRTRQLTTFDPGTGDKFRRVPPGARVTVAEADGPGVIGRLWFTFPGWFWQYWDPAHPVDPRILRLLILRVYWDGSSVPSVVAPVGDFFGVGHCEYRHWTSRFLGMSSGGFYSYFPMPFHSVRIEVENLHESMDALFFTNITWQQEDAIPAAAGRFHCTYHQEENPGAEPLTILDASGRGHFAGCCVSLQGRDPNYLAFLEAPEYVFIDDDAGGSVPTFMGTGLEDYFNGGWYFRDQEFSAPLHGVPLKDPLRSMVSMYRFHDADAIAFARRLLFQFRNPWKADRLKPFRASSTAYWYREGAGAVPDVPSRAALTALYRVRDMDHQSQP
jgi:hypothetical protein